MKNKCHGKCKYSTRNIVVRHSCPARIFRVQLVRDPYNDFEENVITTSAANFLHDPGGLRPTFSF